MIFLGIIIELGTIIASIYITSDAMTDSILELPKNGYKIEKEFLDKYQKQQKSKPLSFGSKFKQIVNAILLFIPGVNLLTAAIRRKEIKNRLINDEEVKKHLILLTENEKIQYSLLESKQDKLLFTAILIEKSENESLKFFKPKPVDHGLATLNYDKLLPLSYTYDEVKKLNTASTFVYRFGKVDGRNIAIIGFPYGNIIINKVKFGKEDCENIHNFEVMSEEEAMDKTFVVYPFTTLYEKEVEKTIEEIKQSRINEATTANLNADQNLFTFISNNQESLENIQVPVLRKKLKK